MRTSNCKRKVDQLLSNHNQQPQKESLKGIRKLLKLTIIYQDQVYYLLGINVLSHLLYWLYVILQWLQVSIIIALALIHKYSSTATFSSTQIWMIRSYLVEPPIQSWVIHSCVAVNFNWKCIVGIDMEYTRIRCSKPWLYQQALRSWLTVSIL